MVRNRPDPGGGPPDARRTEADPRPAFLRDRERISSAWTRRIAALMEEAGPEAGVGIIARRTGKAEKTVRKWLNGIPAKRDSVICLAYALGRDRSGVDELLDLSLFPRLYVKNPDDAIWIYLLGRPDRDDPVNCETLHELYRREFVALFQGGRRPSLSLRTVDTGVLAQACGKVRSDRAFRTFLRDHEDAFRTQYDRLKLCICRWFDVEDPKDFWKTLDENIGDEARVRAIGKRIHRFTGVSYGKNRIRLDVPKRDHIIALGVYLAMPVDKINELLEICGFTPLGAPDLVIEQLLLYLLEDLEETDPDLLGIPEADLDGEMRKRARACDVTRSGRRGWAHDSWSRAFGIPPLEEVRSLYYDETDGERRQFLPYSVAEYILARMEESSVRELRSSGFLRFL